MSSTLEANKSSNALMWTAAIAVILFCIVGIAAIMGWIPTSLGRPSENIESVAPDAVKPGKVTASTPRPAPAKIPASPHPVVVASNVPARPVCADCGVIESTREIAVKGEGSGLGAVGGAVVGGLLGNQVGSGRGNTAATAIGAVGGAVAGNEIEKRVKTNKTYEITVRFDDGSSRVISQATAPAWRSGDHVKVVGGAIQANNP